jgi:hypothetical protein
MTLSESSNTCIHYTLYSIDFTRLYMQAMIHIHFKVQEYDAKEQRREQES